MSAERKKLLWISISAVVVVLIVIAAGFFLFSPKKGGASAPATVGNSAPPKAQDPQDFLAAPLTAPAATPEQPHNQDGGVIIVYGDKPTLPDGTTAPGAAASAVPSAAAAAGTSPAAPSAAPPSTDATSPAASLPAKAPSTQAGAAIAPAAKASVAKAPTAKKPLAKPTLEKAEEYWIQAASFSSRGRADELKTGLAEKGMAALISVKDISGKSWYRVRIGPYSTKAEADGWLDRIKGLEGSGEAYVSKMVVQRPKR